MNRLEDFLILPQKALFSKLCRMYKGTAISSKGDYILVPGEAPIMLIAHLDTVHKDCVKQICKTQNGNILMSPQGIGGDDRCGVFALVKAHNAAKKKPWLLFTCDEEAGGIGANTFCTHHGEGKLPKGLDDLKMLVEIDRKGEKDAVYYDCANDAFEKYITSKGFETQWGSFSDISVIAPELGTAAVNLSSGYYNAHTFHEYINRNHLNVTIKKVGTMIADAAQERFPKYEYIEKDLSDFGEYPEWDNFLHYTYKTKKIPREIRKEYEALLDFYTSGELEALREEYGDNIIPTLFDSEFSSYFDNTAAGGVC